MTTSGAERLDQRAAGLRVFTAHCAANARW
jgi:hypothetical protein